MSNKKDKQDPKDITKSSELKVHKDFNDFGRITSENLTEYFDIDIMATARRLRDKR